MADKKDLLTNKENAKVVYDPMTPYETQVTLKTDKKLCISGIPAKGIKRFNINFDIDEKNTVFHFDGRFDFGSDENIVVTASKQNDDWIGQEKHKCFPFKVGQYFEMVIEYIKSEDVFTVFVNNILYTRFHPLFVGSGRVRKLKIMAENGDLSLKICAVRPDI